jgi:hypothetical protein
LPALTWADAALEVEVGPLATGPLVDQLQPQAPGQEGHLAQPRGQRVERVVGLLEDLAVGQEGHRGAGLRGLLALLQRAQRRAPFVLLRPHEAVAADLDPQVLRQRVHDRDADAVQTAGDLVAVAPELAAGVQLGQHHLDGRQVDALHVGDGDAAAVVSDGHPTVGQERGDDVVAVALKSLVDAVVDDLVDEVMEAPGAGRADVHAGPPADCLEALENGDVFGVIARCGQRRNPLG